MTMTRTKLFALTTALPLMAAMSAHAGGPTFGTDVEVQGSLCVGNDCPGAPAYGFDTIRLQENNLRIHFDDTSVAAAFPRNDWRIYANDSANGGSSYWGVEDATAGRFVFRVFAGARSNALTVDSQGDVGLGTTTPALDIDIKTGDTPSIRLQQDGTSGFTPQTWDVAGNEAGFFIRDATSGSTLPFRIITGGAPSQSLVIDDDGSIGIGAGTSPDGTLHIDSGSANTDLLLEQTGGTAATWIIRNNEATGRLTYRNDTTGLTPFKMGNDAVENLLRVGITANDEVDVSGDLIVSGTVTTGGPVCGGGCDRVFDADYELMPIEDHAALMFANRHLPAVGPTGPDIPMNLTDKMGDMLNELEVAHIYIDQLHDRLRAQEQRYTEQAAAMSELTARLEKIEAR